MAIMIIKRKLILLLSPIFLLVSIFLFTNLVAFPLAKADSSLGDEITIEYVGESTYSSSFSGAKYKIISPSNTQDVLVAFEDDFEWLIKDDSYIGEEIPYISVSSLASSNPELYTSPVLNSQTNKYESFVILRSNGDLYSKCTVNDGLNTEFEYALRVKSIDWVGPRILIETEDYWVDWTSNKYITHYSVEFTDTFLGLRYPTESSGMKSVEVFYINRSLSDIVNENISNPSNLNPAVDIEGIKEDAGYVTVAEFNNVMENTPLSFDISDSGYYYYVALDFVGNITLGFLGLYTQLSQEGFDLPMANGSSRNVYSYFQEAKLDIASFTGIISQTRVDKLQQALDTSYFAFLMGETPEELRNYYDLFVAEWAKFKEGKTKAFFEIDYSKPDDFSLSFLCTNLNKDTIECINGDEIILDVRINKLDEGAFNTDSGLSYLLVNNDSYNVVYKIEYSVKLNGIKIVPKTPLFFDFVHNQTLSNISVISTVDGDNPQLLSCENGLNYIRISSILSNREFYIVGEETNTIGKDDSTFVLVSLIIMSTLSGGAFLFLTIWVEKQRRDYNKLLVNKL